MAASIALLLEILLANFLIIFLTLILFSIVYCSRFYQKSELPEVFYSPTSQLIPKVLQQCPKLYSRFKPTFLWGKNGHIQSILYMVLPKLQTGRERKFLDLSDGTQMSFDIFRSKQSQDDEELIIAVCPGFASSSDSCFGFRLCNYACPKGCKVAVLNHLGTLKDITLKTPRIFSYDETEEYAAMIKYMKDMYPKAKFISIGVSLGSNIVAKYFSEHPARQLDFLCGISVCNGYDVRRAIPSLNSWMSLSWLYTVLIGESYRKILRRHSSILLTEDRVQRYGLDLKRVLSFRSLFHLDDVYCRLLRGSPDIGSFYDDVSCASSLPHITKMPFLCINARDDPIVIPEILEIPINYARNNPKALTVFTKHGGHMGFFEGGSLFYRGTWLVEFISEYIFAVSRESN